MVAILSTPTIMAITLKLTPTLSLASTVHITVVAPVPMPEKTRPKDINVLRSVRLSVMVVTKLYTGISQMV